VLSTPAVFVYAVRCWLRPGARGTARAALLVALVEVVYWALGIVGLLAR